MPHRFKLKKIDSSNVCDLCIWVIVHSILYYEYDISYAPDNIFDHNAKVLYNYIQNNNEEFKNNIFYELLHDFNGCTGMDIPNRIKNYPYYKMIMVNVNNRYKEVGVG